MAIPRRYVLKISIQMTHELPAPEQIAAWISQIESDTYFDRRSSVSGVLFLRVKSPRSQYQGIHFGLSREARDMVESKLEALKSRHDKNCFTLKGCYPTGRAWFNLYSSGLDVSPWTSISFILTTELDVPSEIEWENERAVFKLTNSGRETFIQALRKKDVSPLRLELPIRRTVKPESEPHSCWIWEWEPNKHITNRCT